MFMILPKSRTAAEKAALLNSTQLAHIDMWVTAAFLRPDSYVKVVECFSSVQQGRRALIPDGRVPTELMIVFVISPSGKWAITDFHLFESFDSAPISLECRRSALSFFKSSSSSGVQIFDRLLIDPLMSIQTRTFLMCKSAGGGRATFLVFDMGTFRPICGLEAFPRV